MTRLPIPAAVRKLLRKAKPFSSRNYWTDRYIHGQNSGPGSYGHLARFKAGFLNEFVVLQNIQSVIEFGSGDGNQLALADYPHYVGYDISDVAIEQCRKRFADDSSKEFHLVSQYDGRSAELALSLDVIFHLIEDRVFHVYMCQLFAAASRFVVIYSSNMDNPPVGTSPHVRHRRFTGWVDANVAEEWRLIETVLNPYPYNGDYQSTSFADFYVFEKCRAHVP